MPRVARLLPIVFLAAACTRPVAGRDVGSIFITDLVVEPQFIKADVPIRLSFRAIGGTPKSVTYELGNGTVFDCEPENQAGRLVCSHPGVSIADFNQGPTSALVAAVDDDGKRSVTTAPITIDFDCPTFLALTVVPQIARPDETVAVGIETSEPLSGLPRVSRVGRAWEGVTERSPTSFVVNRVISAQDPSSFEDIVVTLVDRAGNSTQDCGQDGREPFAVDTAPPTIDPTRIMVTRGAPGSPTIIEAEGGAFLDDVEIAEIRVVDSATGLLLTKVTPDEAGALEPTSLGGMSQGRVIVEALDRLGQTTSPMAVPERWRLSLGTASTPNAAVRSAARYTPAPPRSPYMSNRTIELAPALLDADARSAVVRARMGFDTSGQLPNAYEDVFWIAAGYETIGSAIVMFGGQKIVEGNETYYDRTIVLRWNERTSSYEFESGPPAQLGTTPAGRGAHRIAFDGNGCGIMFGGDGLRERGGKVQGIGALNDTWRICRQMNGSYEWTRITPVNEMGNGFPLIRRTPIIYDPQFERYVIVGGYSNAGGLFPIDGAMHLEPGDTLDDWSWVDVTPLPTNFGERHSHLTYFDEELQAPVTGLGYVVPRAANRAFWVYQNGQWTDAGPIPAALEERQGFSYDYDSARRQLVLWGDNNFPFSDTDVWILRGSALAASTGWSNQNLDPPVPRAHPTLVYDPNREVTVAFGGLRFDDRFVPPTVYSIINEPSYPYLAADIDLAAAQPKGIASLGLVVRASGYGDADSVGPETDVGNGVVVKLWDHVARDWVDVADADTPGGTAVEIPVSIEDRPERFVSPDGVVPVTVVTRWPGTAAVESQLDVDQVDGWLVMRPGVMLP